MKRFAFGGTLAVCASSLLACSSNETANDGALRGTLMVYVATMDDGTSRTEYELFVGGSESDTRTLVFENPPDLVSGSEIELLGEPRGREVRVEHFEIAEAEAPDGIGMSPQAIIDGTPYATRSVAYVLVDIGGGNGNYAEAQARIDVFGTGDGDASLKQWFLENSYGTQDISGEVVTGLSFTMTGCDFTPLAAELRPRVNEMLGMSAQHYLWQLLSRNSSCPWSGVASVGTPMAPRLDTWFNASAGCSVLAQEPIHNFGSRHSSSLRCSGASFANNPSSCTHSEYGDPFDPLGSGCRHTNAWQKAYLGWFSGCNRVRVNQSGTFTLHPLEVECNGIQVLQVPMPVTTRTITRSGGGDPPSNDPVQFYYLELRTRTGFDAGMTNAPVVLVHVGPEYGARNITGKHTWLLDMNPSTSEFDGMAVGQTFADPAGGVSFRVQSASASSATIDVTVPTNTANSCSDGGVLPSPGGALTCNGGVGAGGGAGMGGSGGRGGGGSSGRGGGGAGGRNGAGVGGASGAGLGGYGAEAGIFGTAGAMTGGAAGAGGADAGGLSATSGEGGAISGAGVAGTPLGGASAGAGPSLDDDTSDEPGCGCRVPKATGRNEWALFFGLLGISGALVRRVRRRSYSGMSPHTVRAALVSASRSTGVRSAEPSSTGTRADSAASAPSQVARAAMVRCEKRSTAQAGSISSAQSFGVRPSSPWRSHEPSRVE